VKDDGQDTVFLVWSYLSRIKSAMDTTFFSNILRYDSDVFEKKRAFDPLQMNAFMEESDSCLVFFTGKGSLGWKLAYAIQSGLGPLGRAFGYRACLKEYTENFIELVAKEK